MGTGEPTQFTASAFNHGISERQIREVLANDSREEFELAEDANGDPCEMVVGYDLAGRLVEIGICYESDVKENVNIRVFHAWKARNQWQKEYNLRKQNRGLE